MSPIFILLAALTVGGAMAAMMLRNAVHCALSLVVTFVGLAGIYLGLDAHFLGLAQVLVYVGAVAILLVFVLLLTRGTDTPALGEAQTRRRSGLVVGIAVALVLLAVAVTPPLLPARMDPPLAVPVRELGEALMTSYMVPLQVVGVLLTAGMIGAAIIALPERTGRGPDKGGRP